MAVNFDTISERVFKILKSRGFSLKMYKENGEIAYDPSYEARKFFIEKEGIMVSVNSNGENSEIKVYLSDENDLEQMKPLLQSLRQAANFYGLLFNIRKYGKKMKPKEFAFLAYKAQQEEKMNESVEIFESKDMSRLYGSKNLSYQKIGKPTRLIIKHSRPIDENKFAARTRNIDKIFIETYEGERFKFPVNWIQGARAMARHITEEGVWNDDISNYIKNLSEEYRNLRLFSRHTEKNLNEDAKNIFEIVKLRANQISNEVRKMQGPLSYRKFSENFQSEDRVLNEDNILKEIEKINGLFNFKQDIFEQIRTVAELITNEELVNELKNDVPIERKVMNAIDSGLSFEKSKHSPVLKNRRDKTLFQIKDLSERVRDDHVGVFLSRVADKLESNKKLSSEELDLTKRIVKLSLQKKNPIKSFENWISQFSPENVLISEDEDTESTDFFSSFFKTENDLVSDIETKPELRNKIRDDSEEVLKSYVKKQ